MHIIDSFVRCQKNTESDYSIEINFAVLKYVISVYTLEQSLADSITSDAS